jgi:hypothetical protein
MFSYFFGQEQKRYKRFLLSKKSNGRRYMVHQKSSVYICKKHESNGECRIQGRVVGGHTFNVALESELENHVHNTSSFKLMDMKPPVIIWILPDVINDLIREYAEDHYGSEYKKRRISPRGHKRQDPVEVYF